MDIKLLSDKFTTDFPRTNGKQQEWVKKRKKKKKWEGDRTVMILMVRAETW